MPAMKLTEKDCVEIYYALQSKYQEVVCQSPQDVEDHIELDKWTRHLARILTKMGPDGRLLLKEGQK